MSRQTPAATLRRLNAILALQGRTAAQLAAALGVSQGHLRHVVIGQRVPSAKLADGIRQAVTPDGWSFLSGEIDALPDTVAPKLDEAPRLAIAGAA